MMTSFASDWDRFRLFRSGSVGGKQVPHVVSGLRLQVGEVGLGHVIHGHAAGDRVNIQESGTGGLFPVVGGVVINDRRPARSAD